MKSLQQKYDKWYIDQALKIAKPLAKQMELSSIPDDMLEMICPNLDYALTFTPKLYARFVEVKRLLKELSEQTKPMHGHIVKLTTQYETYDESALLLKEGDIRKENLICCSGGKNLDAIELRDYGLPMHIGCGGPFEPISEEHIQNLAESDLFETTYRFWGATPCGNGMISITVPMKRWFATLDV